MRIFFSICILFLFIGCDSILQDRDISPRLSLLWQYQDDKELTLDFYMYSIEQVNSFACEIIFDSEIFELYTEDFVDLNNNGSLEMNEEFYDCGLDRCCDPYEDGNNGCFPDLNPDYIQGTDPNGDNYNPEYPHKLYKFNENVENDSIWNDNSVIFDSLLVSNVNIPHFTPYAKSENGKLSILGSLVEYYDGLPLIFEEIDGKIATIHLKIKQNIDLPNQTIISFGNWQLLQEDGTGAYFGGMVATDTLFVNLN